MIIQFRDLGGWQVYFRVSGEEEDVLVEDLFIIYWIFFYFVVGIDVSYLVGVYFSYRGQGMVGKLWLVCVFVIYCCCEGDRIVSSQVGGVCRGYEGQSGRVGFQVRLKGLEFRLSQ